MGTVRLGELRAAIAAASGKSDDTEVIVISTDGTLKDLPLRVVGFYQDRGGEPPAFKIKVEVDGLGDIPEPPNELPDHRQGGFGYG